MKKLLLLSILAIQACAFADSTLTSTYAPEASNSLSKISAVSQKFIALSATDTRDMAPNLLGYKKNGMNIETADITISPNVDNVIKESVEKLLQARGHSTSAGKNAIDIRVTEFIITVHMGLISVENIARIRIEMDVKNARGKKLKTFSFSSEIKDTNIANNQAIHQRIMNEALSNLMQEIDNSSDLAAALEKL